MYYKSKKIILLILILTAAILSRGVFLFSDDPEGTNLLVTTVFTLVVFLLSWAALKFNQSTNPLVRISLAIFVQFLTVTAFHVFLG